MQREFLRDLRSAFSAIFDFISDADFHSGVPFTLQVSWTSDRQKVTTEQYVDFALGYCLPSHTRYYLLENTRLDDTMLNSLELIFTHPKDRIRTQSHSFVQSRLSGQIRNQKRRPPDTRSAPDDSKFDNVKNIEDLMWENLASGTASEYPHIFMMPLVEYPSSTTQPSLTNRPLPLAHSYLQTKATDDPSLLVAMVHARHKVSALFFEAINRRYCDALAREVAHAAIGRGLEPRVEMISKLYGKPTDHVTLGRLPCSGGDSVSLHDRLTDRRLEQFGAAKVNLPKGISKWLRDRYLHCRIKRDKLDVLLRLRDRFFALIKERERVELVDELEADLAALVQTVTTVRKYMTRHRHEASSQWELLRGFKFLYDDNSNCLCKSVDDLSANRVADSLKTLPDYPKRPFLNAHSISSCCTRDRREWVEEEIYRRLAHLFRAPEDSLIEHLNAPFQVAWPKDGSEVRQRCNRFIQFCRDLGKSGDAHVVAFECIKRAAQSEPKEPTMAAIVLMLYMLRADLTLELPECSAERRSSGTLEHTDLRDPVSNPPDDWPLSLAGIAGLATAENRSDKSSSVFVDPSGDDLRFWVVNAAFYRNYPEIRKKAADGLSGSRVTNLRYAYAQPYGPVRDTEEIGSISVEREPATNGLVVSWRGAFRGD